MMHFIITNYKLYLNDQNNDKIQHYTSQMYETKIK